MDYGPSVATLFKACLVDSFDSTVLVLLTCAICLLIKNRLFSMLIPALLSASLTAFLLLIVPFSISLPGLNWFLGLWIPTLLLIFYSGYFRIQRIRRIHSKASVSFLQALAGHGMAVTGFVILCLSMIQSSLEEPFISWYQINRCSISFVLFYLLFEVEPWRLLPVVSMRELSRVFLYTALGLSVLRGGMWCYGLFNASVKDRPGSFRLKGVMYSEPLSRAWRFNRLNQLIHTYWYYPSHPEQRDQEAPFVKDKKRLYEGLQQAEGFRQSLLNDKDDKSPTAAAIAQAITDFQVQAEPFLQNHETLQRFQLEQDELIEQMRGYDYSLDSKGAFGYFTGRWYGIWDTFQVDHHWRPLEKFDPLERIPGIHPLQMRINQYCWVGDGFAWNAIAVIPDNQAEMKSREVILGVVYHVKNKDPDQITKIRPHVGLQTGNGQLIWITTGEIFLEEVIPEKRKMYEHYAITGFKYRVDNHKLVNNGKAFQAIYSRNPKYRKPFYTFDVSISIDMD